MVMSLSANVRNRRSGRGNQIVQERQLATQLSRSRRGLLTADMGHEDQFALPGLNGRRRFCQAAFAGRMGEGETRR
jgi:hypothetical protein